MATPTPLTSVTRGLAWVLGGVLLVAAVVKVASPSAIAEAFRVWNYPEGTHFVVAALELTAGLLLLVPVSARLGAMLGMAVMGGAVATHLVAGEYGVVGLPLLVGVGLLWVAVAEPRSPSEMLDADPRDAELNIPRSTRS